MRIPEGYFLTYNEPTLLMLATEDTFPWVVYVLELLDGSFYVGFSGRLSQRIEEHVAGKGALITKQLGVKSLRATVGCKTKKEVKLTTKVVSFEWLRRYQTANIHGWNR